MSIIDSPDFSGLSKAGIAAWARDNLVMDIPTAQSKDAMIVAVENAIANYNAAAGLKTAPDNEPAERLSRADKVTTTIVSSPFSNTFPATLNGRTIPIPAHGTVTLPSAYLGLLADAGIQFECKE